jgi:hypothetical protein
MRPLLASACSAALAPIDARFASVWNSCTAAARLLEVP